MRRTPITLATTGALSAALIVPDMVQSRSAPLSGPDPVGQLDIVADGASFVIKTSPAPDANRDAPVIVPLGRGTHLDRSLVERSLSLPEHEHADR